MGPTVKVHVSVMGGLRINIFDNIIMFACFQIWLQRNRTACEKRPFGEFEGIQTTLCM